MQYLVREVQSNLPGSREMIFKTLPDAVKHLQEINSTERLVADEQEDNLLAHLEELLQQRLATVALHTEPDKKKQWVITAFE